MFWGRNPNAAAMAAGKLRMLALVTLVFVMAGAAGCKTSGTARSRTTLNTTASLLTYAITLADNGSRILSSPITAATGELGAVISEASVWAGSTSLVAHPSYRYVYVTSPSTNLIYGFSVSSTGVLSTITGTPFTTASGPQRLAMDPLGRYLYVGCSRPVVNMTSTDTMDLYSYEISATTGALTLAAGPTSIGPVQLTTAPVLTGLVADPSGAYVYALYGTAGATYGAYGYAITRASGAITALANLASSASPSWAAFSSAGGYLHVGAAATTPVVDTFSVSAATGALTTIGSTTTNVAGVVSIPSAARFYQLAYSGATYSLTGWSVDGVGALTSISFAAAPTFSGGTGIAINVDGSRVYGLASTGVLIADVSTTTGALSSATFETLPTMTRSAMVFMAP